MTKGGKAAVLIRIRRGEILVLKSMEVLGLATTDWCYRLIGRFALGLSVAFFEDRTVEFGRILVRR